MIIERAWRANKRIFAPAIEAGGVMTFCRLDRETTLMRNYYGLWEPEPSETIDPRSLDVVVTPLVAFDKQRNRIGMGSGYYDRTFAFLGPRRIWLRPRLVGLAFDCQRARKISPNPWDIPLSCVLTETP